MINTRHTLWKEMTEKCKPNTIKPELGEFTELRTAIDYVEFSLNWYTLVTVTFRPKTIGVTITRIDRTTKEKKVQTKQFPLKQENLLDELIKLL